MSDNRSDLLEIYKPHRWQESIWSHWIIQVLPGRRSSLFISSLDCTCHRCPAEILRLPAWSAVRKARPPFSTCQQRCLYLQRPNPVLHFQTVHTWSRSCPADLPDSSRSPTERQRRLLEPMARLQPKSRHSIPSIAKRLCNCDFKLPKHRKRGRAAFEVSYQSNAIHSLINILTEFHRREYTPARILVGEDISVAGRHF